MDQIDWRLKRFEELSKNELYDLLKLRVDVFVVEQTCYYPELDNLDRHSNTLHLMAYQQEKLIAYLRILPKGTSYQNHPAIGRVVIENSARGSGLGHKLLEYALTASDNAFPGQTIKISAQEHLEKFYKHHGFKRCSDMYLEDGIPHISMLQDR